MTVTFGRRPIAMALVVASLVVTPGGAQAATETVPITMSDGVVLTADIDVPPGPGPFPVILHYTPYGRHSYPKDYVSKGYVHVNVDARGTGRSAGVNCIVCAREQDDVYELIDWASKQPWSTGDVGMVGGSYSAFIQLLVAAKKPPALKAIVPRVSWSDPYRDAWYHNGLFNYAIVTAFTVTQPLLSGTGAPADPSLAPHLLDRPKNPIPLTLAKAHPFDDAFYRERAIYPRFDDIETPALFVGGWFDMFAAGMLRNFNGVASEHKRLIMGPWTHHRAGDIPEYFPEPYPDVHLPSPDPVLAWLDRFLKGINNGVEHEPRVVSFDIGTDEWIVGDQWPPIDSGLVDLHLSGEASGSIASLNDGSLAGQPPAGETGSDPDRYAYDPTSGVAQATGANNAVFALPFRRNDQRLDEHRGLTYTTEKLTSALRLYGPMELNLWAATTGPDTDWVVKISDVQPDGTSLLISTGFVRASQRAVDEARSKPGEPWLRNTEADPVPTGKPVLYRIPMDPVGVTLRVGHRLRVAIYSADVAVHEPLPFPALNTIYHDAAHPSALRLSVALPPDSDEGAAGGRELPATGSGAAMAGLIALVAGVAQRRRVSPVHPCGGSAPAGS